MYIVLLEKNHGRWLNLWITQVCQVWIELSLCFPSFFSLALVNSVHISETSFCSFSFHNIFDDISNYLIKFILNAGDTCLSAQHGRWILHLLNVLFFLFDIVQLYWLWQWSVKCPYYIKVDCDLSVLSSMKCLLIILIPCSQMR